MKKILSILFLNFFLFSFAFADNVEIEENMELDIVEITEEVPENTILVAPAISTSETENTEQTEKSLEKTEIIYYYGLTCPYCQSLNRYLESVDGYNKLNIDKREVWHNRENAVMMTEDIKRLNLENSSRIGVPFIIVNENGEEKVLSGLDQAMAYFEPILGKYDEDAIKAATEEKIQQKAEANKNRHLIFLVVILVLAVLVPVLFIKKSK